MCLASLGCVAGCCTNRALVHSDPGASCHAWQTQPKLASLPPTRRPTRDHAHRAPKPAIVNPRKGVRRSAMRSPWTLTRRLLTFRITVTILVPSLLGNLCSARRAVVSFSCLTWLLWASLFLFFGCRGVHCLHLLLFLVAAAVVLVSLWCFRSPPRQGSRGCDWPNFQQVKGGGRAEAGAGECCRPLRPGSISRTGDSSARTQSRLDNTS